MAKLSTDELLDAFKEMSLVELNEFVKAFEDEFDVKASAPVAVAAAPAAGAAAADEKSEFDVVVTALGDKKIQVIKAIKEITKKGLAESKALADKVPSTILEGASKDDAEKAKKALEDAGASVDLK
ncbi:MAG: 50S ribosomal protein L7/L12 [Aeriscardovia sp.]|nr:50S ribosomal protein L7/L12 [Aeriscardovia sp.]MBQ3308914.1 50S ribosomal protein L7/L12 [Aeriscardovia sp.]MBQ3480431.1 50S ribosomal protein L7/L12 [Aeriscardovia sp.]MBQ5505321.1 50S ribosomal protein L7/L12 [Aeriscardovia sp.]MBR2673472.1 50S ribosomal protein L7/L12 [Aeriscardovia sp.]